MTEGKKDKSKRPIEAPELLAPAGGMTQLVAAVENGADAVYLGGEFLNARGRAENFKSKQLPDAVKYAHSKNVKVYLTMNTLVKDDELQEGLNYAAFAYETGIDALIIQDMGLASLIKERILDMALHLSTQASIYNRSGVDFAAAAGFDTVVVARELSCEELKEICTDSPCRIEVFVHGALCICYSGQCQLSRIIGGRSANRGECAQPCRLPYTDEDGRHEGYYMSPKDLCLLEELPRLIEMGVSSLKIEGRMKSPEYVATVTSIYRKYIDAYMSSPGSYGVEKGDIEDLVQIYSRGGFTKGFFDGRPSDEEYLSGELPKHQGKYIGKVVAVPKARNLVDVKLEAPLEMGDGVEIRASELTGNVVTYIKPLGGGVLRIGDIKGRVAPGDSVYKTGDAGLNERAQASYRNKDKKKIYVDMVFTASLEKGMTLTISEGERQVTHTIPKGVEIARRKAVTAETVKEQLEKTGGTDFNPGEITVHIEKGVNISLSNINKIRRQALEMFAEAKAGRREKVIPGIVENPVLITNDEGRIKGTPQKGIFGKGPLEAVRERQDEAGDIMMIPAVTKGSKDRELAARFERIKKGEDIAEVFGVEKDKPEVLVNNPGWIREFIEAGFTVYGGPGLNIFNGAAKEFYESQGVMPCWGSYELMRRPPLMTMEYDFPLATFLDRKGERYWAAHTGDKTVIEK